MSDRTNAGYIIINAKGEITPQKAHDIGVEYAKRVWGDKYEVIVTTHLNTDCYHNHFVVNSVSFVDGKSIIDRCCKNVYDGYIKNNYSTQQPTLKDFREELLKQKETEAHDLALAIELFTDGSLNTFAQPTNVDINNRLISYDVLELGDSLQPVGMLIVLDNLLNKITSNREKRRQTYIFIDEMYLLFAHQYTAKFLYRIWKRVRKYGAFAIGITQNVGDMLESNTARTMVSNSEFVIMLNQKASDVLELSRLLEITPNQTQYFTNKDAGQGLMKIGSNLVPFVNKFPKDTQLYKLMTSKPGEAI